MKVIFSIIIAFLAQPSWANDADTLQVFFPEENLGYLDLGYNHHAVESNRYLGTAQEKHSEDYVTILYNYGLSDTSALKVAAEHTFIGVGYDKKFVSDTNTVYLSSLIGMHSDITSTYTENGFTAYPRVTVRKAPSSLGVMLKAGLNKRLGSFKVGGSVALKYREEQLEVSAVAAGGGTSANAFNKYTNLNATKAFVSVYAEYDNEYRPNIAYRIVPSYSFMNNSFKNAEAYAAFICEIHGISGSTRIFVNDSNTLELIPEVSHFRSTGKDCTSAAVFSGTLMSLNLRIPL